MQTQKINVEIIKALSTKSQKPYYYLLVTLDNKELGRLFIKETELPYYEKLLGKEVN